MFRLIREYLQSGIDANKAIEKSAKAKQCFFNLIAFQEERAIKRSSKLFIKKYDLLSQKKISSTASEKEIALLRELEKEKKDYCLSDWNISVIKHHGRN